MLFQGKPFEVVVVVPREDTDNTLQSIEKIVQLDDFKFPKLRKLYPEKIRIAEHLNNIITSAEHLEPSGELKERVDNPLEESEKLVELIESELEQLNAKERDLRYGEKRMENMIGLLDESEFIGIATLATKSLEEWESFQSKLQTEGVRVIASRDYEHEKLLLIKGTWEGYLGDSKKIREAINSDIAELKKGMESLSKNKMEITQKYGPLINTLRKQLESEIGLLEEKRKTAHSELFTFIKGIVERKNIPSLVGKWLVLAQPREEKRGGLGQVIQGVVSGKNV